MVSLRCPRAEKVLRGMVPMYFVPPANVDELADARLGIMYPELKLCEDPDATEGVALRVQGRPNVRDPSSSMAPVGPDSARFDFFLCIFHPLFSPIPSWGPSPSCRIAKLDCAVGSARHPLATRSAQSSKRFRREAVS